jgi:hypothetical protein
MAPAAEAGIQADVLEGDDGDDTLEGPDALDLGIVVTSGTEGDRDRDEENGRDLPFSEAAPRDTAREDTVTTGTEAIDQVGAASGGGSSEAAPPERITPQLISSEPDARQEAAPEIPAPAAPDKAES